MIRNSIGIAGLLKVGVSLLVVLFLVVLPVGQGHFLYADERSDTTFVSYPYTLHLYPNAGTDIKEDLEIEIGLEQPYVPAIASLEQYLTLQEYNYVFEGWYEEADGSDNKMNGGELFPSNDEYLYAVWYKPVTCSGKVTVMYVYEEDGETVSVPEQNRPSSLQVRLYRQDNDDIEIDPENLTDLMSTATQVQEQTMVLQPSLDGTKAEGEFAFPNIPYATYIVEVLDANHTYNASYKSVVYEEDVYAENYDYDIGLYEFDRDYINQRVKVRLVYNPLAAGQEVQITPEPELIVEPEVTPQPEDTPKPEIIPEPEVSPETSGVPENMSISESVQLEMELDADEKKKAEEISRLEEEQRRAAEEKKKQEQEIKQRSDIEAETEKDIVIDTRLDSEENLEIDIEDKHYEGAPPTGDNTPIIPVAILFVTSLTSARILQRKRDDRRNA